MSHLTTLGTVTILCYMMGVFVKSKTKIANDLIPIICGLTGIIINCTYHIATQGLTENIILHIGYGALAGIGATGIKEITKIKEILNNGKNK